MIPNSAIVWKIIAANMSRTFAEIDCCKGQCLRILGCFCSSFDFEAKSPLVAAKCVTGKKADELLAVENTHSINRPAPVDAFVLAFDLFVIPAGGIER